MFRSLGLRSLGFARDDNLGGSDWDSLRAFGPYPVAEDAGLNDLDDCLPASLRLRRDRLAIAFFGLVLRLWGGELRKHGKTTLKLLGLGSS